MTHSQRSSIQAYTAEVLEPLRHSHPHLPQRPYSALSFSSLASASTQLRQDSFNSGTQQQRPYSISHRASIASFMTTSTSDYTFVTHESTHSAKMNLQRQVVSKSVLRQHMKEQQKLQQRRTLPLFPTKRTRGGGSSAQNILKPGKITASAKF
jgi:hypothetical protein